jgi:hypothetical protein
LAYRLGGVSTSVTAALVTALASVALRAISWMDAPICSAPEARTPTLRLVWSGVVDTPLAWSEDSRADTAIRSLTEAEPVRISV